jgi:hypothetical protein
MKSVYQYNFIVYLVYILGCFYRFTAFIRIIRPLLCSFSILCGLLSKIGCIEFLAAGGCSYIGAVLRSSWGFLVPLAAWRQNGPVLGLISGAELGRRASGLIR